MLCTRGHLFEIWSLTLKDNIVDSIYRKELSLTERLVLADLWRRQSKYAVPTDVHASAAEISMALGISSRRTYYAIANLEAKGHLSRLGGCAKYRLVQ